MTAVSLGSSRLNSLAEDEMHVQCVQVSMQLKGQGLLEVGPVDVAQHVKQILADLLHQRLEGAGEFSA